MKTRSEKINSLENDFLTFCLRRLPLSMRHTFSWLSLLFHVVLATDTKVQYHLCFGQTTLVRASHWDALAKVVYTDGQFVIHRKRWDLMASLFSGWSVSRKHSSLIVSSSENPWWTRLDNSIRQGWEKPRIFQGTVTAAPSPFMKSYANVISVIRLAGYSLTALCLPSLVLWQHASTSLRDPSPLAGGRTRLTEVHPLKV